MALAMAWPCTGPRTRVRRMSRSRVPCRRSRRSLRSLVDILGEGKRLPVECQGERGIMQVPRLRGAVAPLARIVARNDSILGCAVAPLARIVARNDSIG